MSVINNVLKDLERRGSQFTPIEISSIETSPAPRRGFRPVLYAGLLLLLLACGAAIYQYGHWFAAPATVALAREPALPAAPAVDPQPVAEPAPPAAPAASSQSAAEPAAVPAFDAAPAPAAAVHGNQIVGLQIRESETEMRLEFALRERAVAYLKERGETHFAYHLRDTGSDIVAPLMRDNPWIRSLSIEESDQGVDIDFTTAAGILVETRQQRREGQPMWVIDLRQSRPVATAQGASGAAAITEPAPPNPPVTAQAPAPAVAEVAPVKVDIKATSSVAATTSRLEYAVDLMNSGRAEDAENLLLGLLGGSDDYRAREHLVVLYTRHKRPERLRSLLQSSLVEYPRDPLFSSEYALSIFQAGAYGEVVELLAHDDALDARQSALLAASYQRLDQHEAAVLHYRQALRQDAADPRNWVGLGISQEQTAAFAEALDSYQRAASLGGLNARLLAFVERRSENLRRVID